MNTTQLERRVAGEFQRRFGNKCSIEVMAQPTGDGKHFANIAVEVREMHGRRHFLGYEALDIRKLKNHGQLEQMAKDGFESLYPEPKPESAQDSGKALIV